MRRRKTKEEEGKAVSSEDERLFRLDVCIIFVFA